MPIQFPPDPNKYPPILQDETAAALDAARAAQTAARHAAQVTGNQDDPEHHSPRTFAIDAVIHAEHAQAAATYAKGIADRPFDWIDAEQMTREQIRRSTRHAQMAQGNAAAALALTFHPLTSSGLEDGPDPLQVSSGISSGFYSPEFYTEQAGRLADAAHRAARTYNGPHEWPAGNYPAKAAAIAAQATRQAAHSAQAAYTAAIVARQDTIRAAAAIEELERSRTA